MIPAQQNRTAQQNYLKYFTKVSKWFVYETFFFRYS